LLFGGYSGCILNVFPFKNYMIFLVKLIIEISGVQGKNNAYHNVNKVKNSLIITLRYRIKGAPE
jgi:hypothetical protein